MDNLSIEYVSITWDISYSFTVRIRPRDYAMSFYQSCQADKICHILEYMSLQRKKIAIAGATGFIGSRLCEVLADDFDIVGLVVAKNTDAVNGNTACSISIPV